MFRSRKDKMVQIDNVYPDRIKRNGIAYTQVSYWDKGTRYSTIIDCDVKPPNKGDVVKLSSLKWSGIEYNQNLSQKPTLEQALAKRCFDGGRRTKHAQLITEFNIDSLRFVRPGDGEKCYISPEDVRPYMFIKLECTTQDMDTGLKMITNEDIDVVVKDFAYQDGNLLIETPGCIFSSIDFSKELKWMTMEKEQDYEISYFERG